MRTNVGSVSAKIGTDAAMLWVDMEACDYTYNRLRAADGSDLSRKRCKRLRPMCTCCGIAAASEAKAQTLDSVSSTLLMCQMSIACWEAMFHYASKGV